MGTSMVKDGPKRHGRFLKKSNKRLMDSVVVSNFNLAEICATEITFQDNPNGNIIHVRKHDNDDLQRLIQKPPGFDDTLQEKEARRPVLQPIDFTSEWLKEKSGTKKRSQRNEEDDDDLLSDAEAAAVLEAKNIADDLQASVTAADEDEAKFEMTVSETSLDELQKTSSREESMNLVGKAIKNLAHSAPTSFDSEENAEKRPDEFIPTSMVEEPDMRTAEMSAMDEYRNRQNEVSARHRAAAVISEGEKQAIVVEANARGFAEGFKHGEEKAELQGRQRTEKLFSTLDQLIKEFESLKKNILLSAQENFYELCQAIAESLLRREFNIDPQSFGNFLQRAVSDTVTDDKFKIAVSPGSYAALAALDLSNLNGKIVQDVSVAEGDFRIDSQSGVVDGNLHQLVETLLSKAGVELFPANEEKAS